MDNDFWSSYIRKNLTSLVRGAMFTLGGALGAWLLAKGFVDADAVKRLINWLTSSATEGIVAFIITIAYPTIWNFIKNHKEVRTVEVARSLPAGSSVEKLNRELKMRKR